MNKKYSASRLPVLVFTALLLAGPPARGAALNMAFLGIQTDNSRTFQGLIYDRIYDHLSLNPDFSLLSRAKIQDIHDYRQFRDLLLTAEDANEIYNRFDSHIILCIKVVERNLEKRKWLGVLPFGYARGRIKYQIVLWNAMRLEPKFQGEFEISSSQFLGYCGFSPAAEGVLFPAEQQKILDDKLNVLMVEDVREKLFHGLSGINKLSVREMRESGL